VPVPAGALVPVTPVPVDMPDAEARTVASSPITVKGLSPRMRLAIVGVVAATVLGMAVIVLHKQRLERIKQGNTFAPEVYNHHVNSAVDLCREENPAAALKLLEALAARGDRNNRKTAEIFMDALKASRDLKTDFAKRWEESERTWEELYKYSGSTPEAQMYAQQRLDWIKRESGNMGRYNSADAAYKRGDYPAFFEQAAKISEDSIFRDPLGRLMAEAQAQVVQDYTGRADRAEAAENWKEAADHLRTIVKFVPAMAADLQARIEKLVGYDKQSEDLANASAMLDKGQIDEAIAVLQRLAAGGPYRDRSQKELERAKKLEAERTATKLYDAGKGQEAMNTLKGLGAENDALGRRIAAVMERFDAMNKLAESLQFTTAKNAAQQIQRLESNPRNYYRLKADELYAGVDTVRRNKAREAAEAARGSYAKDKFRESREKCEEALRIDPQCAEAAQLIGTMKKDAMWDYNRALQLVDEKPEEAQKIFQQVMDRLAPNDNYHGLARDRIREIQEKLKK